ncbi:MAG: polyprenyl synthetase family protein [Candidatus Woesearchaeota archaeon]
MIEDRIRKIFSGIDVKDPSVVRMVDAIREFCLRGGKRIRPQLAMLSYKELGGKDEDSMLNVAAVLEMVHAYLLVHDDIMDESRLRRGKPTVHEYYNEFHENGVHMGMLAGDTLVFIAYKALLRSGFSAEKTLAVSQLITDVLLQTCYGQAIDYEKIKPVDKERVLEMYRLKTSVYSIEAPLLCGALLADASQDFKDSLSAFAEPLGIAFQIQDDLLDIFPQSQTGKARFGDLREGKHTLLVWYVMNHGDAQTFEKHLGTDMDEKTGELLAEIIESSGAKSYAENKIDELYKQALSVLDDLPDMKKSLTEFAERIMKRKN